MADEKPFAVRRAGQPFFDNVPYLGGWVRVLAGGVAAATEIPITHGLRVSPRGLMIWDSGASFTPAWKRGPTPWTGATIYVVFATAVAATDTLTMEIF